MQGFTASPPKSGGLAQFKHPVKVASGMKNQQTKRKVSYDRTDVDMAGNCTVDPRVPYGMKRDDRISKVVRSDEDVSNHQKEDEKPPT